MSPVSFGPVAAQIAQKCKDQNMTQTFEMLEAHQAAERSHKSTTHEEMYFHVRVPIAHNGKHVTNGTVFFRRVPDGVWHYAVARCSDGDQFCREVGRNIARRRYFKGVQMKHGREKPTYDDAMEAYRNVDVIV